MDFGSQFRAVIGLSWEHSTLHSALRSPLHSALHSSLHSALHSDLHSAPPSESVDLLSSCAVVLALVLLCAGLCVSALNKPLSFLKRPVSARSARARASRDTTDLLCCCWACSCCSCVAAPPSAGDPSESADLLSSCAVVLALVFLLLSLLLLRLQFSTLSSLTRFPFYDSQVLCWCVFGCKIAPRGSKSDSHYFFSAPRASKSAPRGSQEAFRRLPRRRCDRGPVLDPFLTRFLRPWDLKNQRIS